jgi:hypothetical protein
MTTVSITPEQVPQIVAEAKTAQDKFNAYLAEFRETSDVVNDFVDSSYDNNKSYAYAAGALSVIVKELIAEMPRAKRAKLRDRIRSIAQDQKNELLLKTIKKAV